MRFIETIDKKTRKLISKEDVWVDKKFEKVRIKYFQEYTSLLKLFYTEFENDKLLNDQEYILKNLGLFGSYSSFKEISKTDNSIFFGINGQIIVTCDNTIHFVGSNCKVRDFKIDIETPRINQSNLFEIYKITLNDINQVVYGRPYTDIKNYNGKETILQNGNSFITLKNDTIVMFKKLLNILQPFSDGLESKIFKETNQILENEVSNNIVELKQNLIGDILLNKDGKLELITVSDFNIILEKYQEKIIDIDKSYILKFVKISNYLKDKRSNIFKIYERINKTKDVKFLNSQISLLKNQIVTLETLYFHSISMVTTLINNDLITFYEIYECFDKLGVFNSNWENEINSRLNSIESKLDDILNSIYELEVTMIKSMSLLTYVTKDSFKNLEKFITLELRDINSNLKFNNLLNTIQTYKMLKR